jgi:hypothetical protein
LRALPEAMLNALPETWRKNPQIQAEIERVMLESVAVNSLEAISGDGDHPVFLPYLNWTLNIAQPNADTNYRAATITPGGTYRLRGYRGSLRIAKILELEESFLERGLPKSAGLAVYHDLNELPVDKDGRFDVLLSPQRPIGYTGEWWKLNPKTSQLFARFVSSNWERERDPTISIERIDIPANRPRPKFEEINRAVEKARSAIPTTALLFMSKVANLRKEGVINKFKVFDVGQTLALEGQFYYEGTYDLKPDEALVVSARVPFSCKYYSMLLTNQFYETTDWYNNQSSLNDSQMRIDSDGILRVVVSAQDPGIPNWLDTAGYPIGVIQGRWTECNERNIPSIQKIRVSDVRRLLPADTPAVTGEQRQRLIRERRSQLQRRPLW